MQQPNQPASGQNNTMTFQQAMSQLEQIVAQLNNPNLELEQAMSLYQQGLSLSRFCQERLDTFEKQMNQMMAQENGQQ